MSATARHCPTCTCAPSQGGFCDSDVTVLHEVFQCLEPMGHDGVHVGAAVPSPCPACGGREEHADSCPGITSGKPEFSEWACPYEVQWDAEGTVTFAEWPNWKHGRSGRS